VFFSEQIESSLMQIIIKFLPLEQLVLLDDIQFRTVLSETAMQ
jgi:hypothetical protein